MSNDINKQYIIAIDNDECIGSWSDLSLLYSILKNELNKEPEIELFVKIITETFAIRPYVKDLYNYILNLKKENIVYKIFMFTAASNSSGWVLFLSKVLEKWFGENIYDEIIHQEIITEWNVYHNIPYITNNGYIKNLNIVREIIQYKYNIDTDKYHIIAIDDRPENIINGTSIGVSPYKVAVNLFLVIKLFVPNLFDTIISKYDNQINISWEIYLSNPLNYSKTYSDNDISKVIDYLDLLIRKS